MSERNGYPWPAPQSPPTRSLTWPAPTCETPSRLPDGTRVRTPNGSTGVIESHDGREYDVFSAADGITYLMTDRDLTKSKRRLRSPAKPRNARAVRKVKPARTTPGYLGALKSLSFRNWTHRYRHIFTENVDRSIGFTFTQKRKMLNGKPVHRGTGAHTAACDRRCATNGGKVDHRSRRTPGCPGCKALR